MPMRMTILAAFLALLPTWGTEATPFLTAQQAAASVLHDGYTHVAFTERARNGWNVWATKDGLAYEVKIDPATGAVLEQVPLDNDD